MCGSSRQGFAHPDLLPLVGRNRQGELVVWEVCSRPTEPQQLLQAAEATLRREQPGMHSWEQHQQLLERRHRLEPEEAEQLLGQLQDQGRLRPSDPFLGSPAWAVQVEDPVWD